MDIKNEYSNIFAYTRALLDDELEHNVKFMEYSKTTGHNHSLLYITMVADTLTAYNELYPHPEFVHARNFRQY